MINYVDPIPSTVLLESYNNKIKKLLKYGDGDDIQWVVNGQESAGEVEVTVNLSSGATKTVKVTRTDIATEIPADADSENVTIDVDVKDVPGLANIQNTLMEVSNIGKTDYDALHSPEFAMSVLLWVRKGVYVPPADMILTNVDSPEEDTSLPAGPILNPDTGPKIVKVTEVKIKSNSLAYVGSIRVAQVATSTGGAPAELKEYNLSEFTNVDIPGQWEVNFDVNAVWREEEAISQIARAILDIVGTEKDFQPGWNMTSATKDLDYDVPGKIAYVITPASETPTVRLVGELRLIVTQVDSDATGWINSLSEIQYPGLGIGNAGRRIATVNANISDAQLLSQVETYLSPGYNNDISKGNTLTQQDLNLGMLRLVDITIAGDEVIVRPKPEYDYTHIRGLMIIEIKRVADPIEIVDVSGLFGEDSAEVTYRVNPIFTDEQIKYNVLLDMLKPHILKSTNLLTVDDLVATVDGDILTVEPTSEADGTKINCNVVVNIDRLVAKDTIVNLGTIRDYTLPEPDKSAPDYDFRNIVEDILLELIIAEGSDEVIDIDTISLTYEDRWNGGYITINSPKMDDIITGTLSFYYTDIRPATTHTDLSTMSNISKPGKMIVPKTIAPNSSYPDRYDLAKVLELVTEGLYDIEKLERNLSNLTYSNNLLKVTPSNAVQPNTVVGELNVLYVTFDSTGEWVPALSLSEITNNLEPGVWDITVPKEVTADNYTVVTNAVKTQLQEIYSADTSTLVADYTDGVLTLTVDPSALADATGTLTINTTVDDTVVLPADTFTMTSVTGETTDDGLTTMLGARSPTGDWSVWMNDEIVATSSGLIYNDHITVTKWSSGYVGIKLGVELFSNKTVTFAFDVEVEEMTVDNEKSATMLGRQTTIDSFGAKVNNHRFEIDDVIAVPSILPPHITNLEYTIYRFNSFNQDLSTWDTSNVTNMGYMFNGCHVFNQDISGWDTSNVTNMSGMFSGASAFNQDISAWDVSNVTNMDYMLRYAYEFNQDLSNWNVIRIAKEPFDFGAGVDAWTLPKPVWNTLDSGSDNRG